MAQLIVLATQEQNPELGSPVESLGVMAHICNRSVVQVETGRFLALAGQSFQQELTRSRPQERACLK